MDPVTLIGGIAATVVITLLTRRLERRRRRSTAGDLRLLIPSHDQTRDCKARPARDLWPAPMVIDADDVDGSGLWFRGTKGRR